MGQEPGCDVGKSPAPAPGDVGRSCGGGVEKGLKESCCARYHFIVKVSLRVSSLELDIVGHFYVTVLRWIVDGLVSRLVR